MTGLSNVFLTVCHSDTRDMARGQKKRGGFKPQFCCLLKAPRATWELSRTTGCCRCWNIFQCVRNFTDRDSSVGIATRYGFDGPGIESRWEARFSATVQTGPGIHPTSYTMCTVSFPGVKRPEGGVDNPPHLTQRLKKE